ncbi:polysaccharide biosynthesis protein [Kibdelosporangium philippinense]|uniref:Polysaccharide biosynthesis protein n=1 Tax=Kibdelosporangium philippinense TaxID=211113 RepID=A0ABS8ZUT5_9PSEU|nr:polysaccharide biosynthesis protein [Kibdelosporangium philippinense]MCE7010735.1 polysaccharide biosynthesis protein [Kibdelosporangium philippinense]
MASTLSARTRVGALYVAAAFAGTNIASYVMTVIAARLLVPATFGEFGSLTAVLVIGAVPAMGLQTVVALKVAKNPQQDRGQLVTLGLLTSGTIMLTALVASPLLMGLLHVNNPWTVVFLALAVGPITLIGLCYGILQGTERFGLMARLIALEGVGRVGGTLTGLLVFRTPTGAFAGAAIGASLVAGAGWLICGRPLPGKRGNGHVTEVLHAIQALLALVLLVNLDLVLARHALPAHEAGEYAVGSVVTKIAYWLPYAIAVVVLPKLANEDVRRRLVPKALGIVAAVDSLVVVGCAVLGPTVVALVGGAAYSASSIPVWPFALVGSLLSLVQLLLYSRIASADRRSTLLTWLAVVTEITLVLGWWHGSLSQVVTGAVVATAALACFGALIEFRTRVEPVDTR